MDYVLTGHAEDARDNPMKLKIDHQADALYLSLSEKEASNSVEMSPGIIVDFDEAGIAVGIEILHLSKRTGETDFNSLLFESVPLAG